ncbi:MAG: TIGR00296 family protein [Aigarchaeota archaeon]|nr:TIGR00296 family protein [Aigarchaeota archaeon]MCX8193367.1 TIGR00296 family protein [Nitrososphaeria archaeon]MDW7985897.1 TIGR00296 family protein [Nitrososphaerota archaeon]
MEKLLSLEEGRYLVRLARQAIYNNLRGIIAEPPPPPSERLKEKRGVFVTLYTYPVKDLRGCIGFPLPTLPLHEATIQAAISSAIHDPRFNPLEIDELKNIIIEVSVLTPPEEIVYRDPRELLEKINIGRDGLIIKSGPYSGLLLPQVPVEFNWNVEEYLIHLCLKAGLEATHWLKGKAKIYRFTAQIFRELEPNGEIVEEELKMGRF